LVVQIGGNVPTKKPTAQKAKKRSNKGGKFLSLKRGRATGRVRKNMDMDAAKLAAVKQILGATTETEAVERAFDEIIFEHKVTAGLERLADTGGLPNVDPDA
jgi:Arc/MetJ family transcription regulator